MNHDEYFLLMQLPSIYLDVYYPASVEFGGVISEQKSFLTE
jgi:hypothetical protein